MTNQKKQVFIRVTLAVLILVIVTAVIKRQLNSSANTSKQASHSPVVVSTIVAKLSTVNKKMLFSGQVVGREEIPVFADLAQGRIVKVAVEEGQHVEAGQLLASVDATALKIQKSQQEAVQQRAFDAIAQQETLLDEAKIQFEQAKSEKLRADAIAETGLLSTEAIEQRATNAKIAESRVRAAQSNLAMAKSDFSLAKGQAAESSLRINQASIASPSTGRLISVKARAGLVLGPNTEPLFVILRDNLIEVEIEVSASELEQLKNNAQATIQIIGNASIYHGKIRHSAAQIDSQSQLAKVRVSFNKPQDITLGQTARVTIMLGPKKAVYLPESAIIMEANTSYVFAVIAGKAQRTPIKTGELANGLVEVVDGITTNAVIVDRFAAYLHDGEMITVVNAPSAHLAQPLPIELTK